MFCYSFEFSCQRVVLKLFLQIFELRINHTTWTRLSSGCYQRKTISPQNVTTFDETCDEKNGIAFNGIVLW